MQLAPCPPDPHYNSYKQASYLKPYYFRLIRITFKFGIVFLIGISAGEKAFENHLFS
jgi:hypothetical protein